MSNLVGIWRITQKWAGSPAYHFEADFLPNGTIRIPGTKFFGVYKELGSSNQVSLAIAQFTKPNSISTYVGNVAGNAMGGEARGAVPGGEEHDGEWTAVRLDTLSAPKQDHKLPG